MEELSTQQLNLVKSLYNETSLSEDITLNEILAYDFELQEEFLMLKEAKTALPKALFNPSNAALDNILKYSRSTATEHYC